MNEQEKRSTQKEKDDLVAAIIDASNRIFEAVIFEVLMEDLEHYKRRIKSFCIMKLKIHRKMFQDWGPKYAERLQAVNEEIARRNNGE